MLKITREYKCKGQPGAEPIMPVIPEEFRDAINDLYKGTETLIVNDVKTSNVFDGYLENGAISTSNGNDVVMSDRMRSNYILIDSNTAYKFIVSGTIVSNFNVIYYNANKEFISNIVVSNKTTFTTPTNAKYIRFYGTTSDLLKKDISIDVNVNYDKYVPKASLQNSLQKNTTIQVENVVSKNILDTSKVRLGTFSGLTVSYNKDGSLMLNGTATDNVDIYLINDIFNIDTRDEINNEKGTYTLSNNLGFENYIRLSTSNYLQDTVTIQNNDIWTNSFVRVPAGTYNNRILKIQIEKGTKATSIVPFLNAQKINEKTRRKILRVGIYDNYTTTSTDTERLNFKEEIVNTSKQSFSLSDGYVVINEESRYALVSGLVNLEDTIRSGDRIITYVSVNSTSYILSETIAAGVYESIQIPNTLISVKKGDKISLLIRSITRSGAKVMGSSVRTFLNVELID